jgi:hypothetical protein
MPCLLRVCIGWGTCAAGASGTGESEATGMVEVAGVIDDSVGRLGVGVVVGGKGNIYGGTAGLYLLGRQCWHRGLCLIGICEGRIIVCG